MEEATCEVLELSNESLDLFGSLLWYDLLAELFQILAGSFDELLVLFGESGSQSVQAFKCLLGGSVGRGLNRVLGSSGRRRGGLFTARPPGGTFSAPTNRPCHGLLHWLFAVAFATSTSWKETIEIVNSD